MNLGEFDHAPLEKLFRAVEDETASLDSETLKQTLREIGLDPDETTASVKKKVQEYLKQVGPS